MPIKNEAKKVHTACGILPGEQMIALISTYIVIIAKY